MSLYPLSRSLKNLSPAGILLAGLLLVTGANAQDRVTNSSLASLLDRLLNHNVPEVGVDSLSALENPVFLDARSGEEYAVSHLEGAAWVGYKDFDPGRLNHLPREQTLVVYCSVGYRSEKIATRLQEAGFQKVYNLYGGIFEWVNRGLPVVDRDGPTDKVHGYNWFWSRWVSRGEVVY